MCVAPLKDSKIGLALRLRLTPSPNRVLDVNLCFLRKIFSEEHEIIRHAIIQQTRCLHEDVPDNTIAEMLFQIILLRFTGRIFRFHYYGHTSGKINSGSEAIRRMMPLRSDVPTFLQHVEQTLDVKPGKQPTLCKWIS
jgi:hypothetical protein